MIAVAVAGARGRMGQTVCEAVTQAPDMELVGRADPLLGVSLDELLIAGGIDVVVDFTVPQTALANALACVAAGVDVVVGTTGFQIDPLRGALGLTDAPTASEAGARAASQVGVSAGGGGDSQSSAPAPRSHVLVAPNFAIGAVLMMRFAVEAARHMAAAEIVELHHDAKLDIPSGTAALTARLIAQGTGGPEPPIHSVRLPGLVAHQEVILGDLGQTLTIRHDSIDRKSFMPGVLLAVRRIATLSESLTVGLEHLL